MQVLKVDVMPTIYRLTDSAPSLIGTRLKCQSLFKCVSVCVCVISGFKKNTQ